MFMTHSQRPRRQLGFRRSVAPVASAMIAVAGLFRHRALRSAPGPESPGHRYDAAVLSEIARGRSAPRRPGRDSPSPVPIAPDAADSRGGDGGGRGVRPIRTRPSRNIAPAREGITVPIPPGVVGAEEGQAPTSATVGYQSNSWRQRPRQSVRGAQLLVGRPRPVVRARPRAEGPRRRTALRRAASSCTAFSCCASRWTRRSNRQLAGLGVQLLGPHDDHHKARLPVGSLEAIAALPEVEWLGVSAPEQKLSSELAELRALEARRPASTPRRRSRSSSTSSRAMTSGDASGASSKPPAPRSASTTPSSQFYRAVATRADHRQDRRPRLRAVRRADRADVPRARPEHPADRRRHDPPGHPARAHALQRRHRSPSASSTRGFEMGSRPGMPI